jgi:integrase
MEPAAKKHKDRRMTIVPRGKRYGVKVWNSTKGSYDWVGTFNRKKDAKDAERAAEKKAATRGITIKEFSEIWQRDYARPSATTRQTYRYGVRGFVDDFGSRRLDSITRPEARAWASTNPHGNARVIRAMYTDAFNDGIVDMNPFAGLRLQQPRGRKDLTALKEEEVDHLADTAVSCLPGDVGPTLAAMILVAGYCGPRPGELVELRRPDDRGDELDISRAIDVRGQVKTPKNGLSRTVVIPPKARRALDQLPKNVGTDLLFVTPRGKQFTKGTLRYWWAQVRQAAGRPDMEFYELRHACATLLLERGLTPADVAIQLGHTDGGRLVMEVYGHPAEEGARNRIKEAFGNDAKKTKGRKAS